MGSYSEVTRQKVDVAPINTKMEVSNLQTTTYDYKMIRQALSVLAEPGSLIEARAFKDRAGTCSGLFDDIERMLHEIVRLSGTVPGIYMTLNPIDPSKAGTPTNQISERVSRMIADEQILKRSRLLIDFDPIRAAIGDVARELLAERLVDDQGQTLFVDCPHHVSVSHRSLHIWRDRQGWYCHGCGVGGDVLQLVEFVESGVVTRGHSGAMPETHRHARDWLAARQGMPPLSHVELNQEQLAEVEAKHAATLRARECLTAISAYYHAQLRRQPEVLAWLEKQYAFDTAVVDAFLIGYANNEGLRAHLEGVGFTLRDLYACGAFRPDQAHDDIAYPVFDRRVIFPYRAKGHVVYLIGRKTPWTPDAPYEQSKYKKLPVYDPKSRRYIAEGIENGVLYNEDLLTTRPEQVIITEGITDCIALIRQGFAAISPVTVNIRAADWTRLLPKLRNVREIILCQDNEVSEAGWKGALRSAHQLSLASHHARVAQLPLDDAQQEARRQLRERFGLRPGEGRAALESRLSQATPQERTAVQLLLEQAKQDVCGYFVAGHSAEEFARVLAAAKSPVEFAIDSIPDGELTTDLLRDIVAPILAQIAGLSTLEQTPLLKRLQSKLGKENAPLGELRQAMREERQRGTSTATSRPKTPSEQADSPPPMTDLGNAERLIKHHGHQLLFCQTSHEWLIWDGRRWANDDQNAARRFAHETARHILHDEVAASTGAEAREAWVKWQRTSESARASTNMLVQATAYLTEGAWPFTQPVSFEAVLAVDEIRDEALRLGWSEAALYQNRGRFRFPCGQDYGLVCCLHHGDRIVEVTSAAIAMLPAGRNDAPLRFYRAPGTASTEVGA